MGGVGCQGGREVSGVRTGGGWGRTSGWERSERCEDRWWWQRSEQCEDRWKGAQDRPAGTWGRTSRGEQRAFQGNPTASARCLVTQDSPAPSACPASPYPPPLHICSSGCLQQGLAG